MISNLIENSIKHSRCEQISIRVEEDGDDVICSIEDDGEGIPDELKEEAFEKGMKKEKAQEAGLGLYLVQQIAEANGGRVEVDDSPMGGAKFDIFLNKV